MSSTESTPAPPTRDPVTLIRAGAIDGFDRASIDGPGTARPGAVVVGRRRPPRPSPPLTASAGEQGLEMIIIFILSYCIFLVFSL